MGKQSDTAPRQCVLSHLPHSAAVFGEKSNSCNPNHHILQISLCAMSGPSKGSGLGIHRKNYTVQDSKSHSQQYLKRTSEVLPAMAGPLNKIRMCRRAELSR
jgi:hypothetical protein